MPKEICTDCEGVVCRRTGKDTYTRREGKRTPKVIVGEIKDCPKKKVEEEDIGRWFALEGKTDTLHLGS